TFEDERRGGRGEQEVESLGDPTADEARFDACGRERGKEDVAGAGRVDDRVARHGRVMTEVEGLALDPVADQATAVALCDREQRARPQRAVELDQGDVAIDVVPTQAQ